MALLRPQFLLLYYMESQVQNCSNSFTMLGKWILLSLWQKVFFFGKMSKILNEIVVLTELFCSMKQLIHKLFITLLLIVLQLFSTTLWNFHDFSVIQILHEINFGDCRSAKSAISAHWEALNFDFLWNFAIFERWSLNNLHSWKLISCKIWMTEKSWKF